MPAWLNLANLFTSKLDTAALSDAAAAA